MCQAFANGHDIHAATAASLHKVALDEVTEDMRRLAKTTNFGIVYGISAQGLASRTEFSHREAATFIETYFATYPGVKTYMDSTIEEAHARGYVETLFQRRRISAGAQFAGVPRAGGGRADGDQHADPGARRRTS